MLNVLPVNANTTRDIGQEPELNFQKIGKWISFYTSLERISKGLNPLLYEPILEKAAEWQAGYCVKIKTLDHYSTEQGMRTIKDRVEHFGGSYNSWGENLTVQFSINSEGILYYIKNDESGGYKDYGSHVIYYRDEQQMGYTMVKNWMNSPGHRANILTAGFTLIGAASAKGVYSNENSYYGCQVFGAKMNFMTGDKIPESEFSKLTVKKDSTNGKAAYSISYNGKLEVKVIEANGEKKPVDQPIIKNGEIWLFKMEQRPEGRLVAVLYDKDIDIMYPVKLLE
jgi:uncharacterized protein YkwD